VKKLTKRQRKSFDQKQLIYTCISKFIYTMTKLKLQRIKKIIALDYLAIQPDTGDGFQTVFSCCDHMLITTGKKGKT